MSLDLHAELWRAMCWADDPRVREMLASLALPRSIQWGIGRIEPTNNRRFYQPAPDGPFFALIVPVVEDGDTIDLCAVMLSERHTATRLGIGAALGLDVIDWARWHQRPLHLVDDPLHWLRTPASSAFVIDWTCAAFVLADLGHIRCATVALAERVERAFRRPLLMPQLQVRP